MVMCNRRSNALPGRVLEGFLAVGRSLLRRYLAT
jgi:hypothetical protein